MDEDPEAGFHTIEVHDRPVQFEIESATGTWHFRVAEPSIVGGGQLTLDEAREAAAEVHSTY